MRELKLPTLASLDNYNFTAFSGTPTKIAPPVGYFENGKAPDRGFGAQWQNYIESAFQKQIELSAQLPFRNFVEIAAIPATTTQPRFSFSPYVGMTFVANGVNNSPKYFQEFLEAAAGPVPLGITLSPAAGNFVPKDLVNNYSLWVFVGSNSTATTKTIWEVDPILNTFTEKTSPVSGSVECVCRDPVTGDIYAFAADTNRSVLKRDHTTGTWSAIGTRGAGATAPSNGSYCAAYNDVLILANDHTNPAVDKITVSPFAVTVHTLSLTDTTTLLDCRWSDPLQSFMVLTQRGWYVFADPATTIGTYSNLDPATANVATGGCLTNTGAVGWRQTPTNQALYIRTWPGEAGGQMKFGADVASPSTGVFVRYDGSAIWFMIDKSGTKRLFRSLRAG